MNETLLVSEPQDTIQTTAIKVVGTNDKMYTSLGAFIRQSSEIQAAPSNEGPQPRQGDISYFERFGEQTGYDKAGVSHYWSNRSISDGASTTYSVNYKNGYGYEKQKAEVHITFRTVPDPAYTGYEGGAKEKSVAAVYKSYDHNANFIRADIQYFEPVIVPLNDESEQKLDADPNYVKVSFDSGEDTFKSGDTTVETQEYYVKKGTSWKDIKKYVPANDKINAPADKVFEKWDPALPTNDTDLVNEAATYTALFKTDTTAPAEPVVDTPKHGDTSVKVGVPTDADSVVVTLPGNKTVTVKKDGDTWKIDGGETVPVENGKLVIPTPELHEATRSPL